MHDEKMKCTREDRLCESEVYEGHFGGTTLSADSGDSEA